MASSTILLLISLVFLGTAAAQPAAIGTRLSGAVLTLDADGLPVYLPGVTITLRKEGESNALFSVVSDDFGEFTFDNVPPGKYVLEAELSGFNTASQAISVSETTIEDLRLVLQVAGVSEDLTVQAYREGIDTQQTAASGRLAQEHLESLPLANERMLDALPMLPGVIRGPDGLLSLSGARPNESSQLINNINVTDPATGNFSFNLPIEAVQSVSVVSSPYSGEYGRFLGAVTEIETRPAEDHWRWLFTNFLPRFRRRDGAIMGIESFTPRLVFSGPILKDKLSLAQTFEYRFVRTRVPSLPELQNDTSLESFDSFTQFDVEFSPEHHLSTVFTLYPEKLGYMGLNTFNPQSVTSNFKRRGYFFGANDRLLFSSGSLLESRISYQTLDADVLPYGLEDMTLTPNVNSGNYFSEHHRFSHRFQSSEVFSFPTFFASGEHQMRIGSYISRDVMNGERRNRPIRLVRSDGSLSTLIEFEGEGSFENDKTEVALFVHDKWTPMSRLTLDLGLRYGHNGLTSEHLFAPRLGFAAALTGDRRTVLRGGAGIFFGDIPLNIGVFTQEQDRLVRRFDVDGGPLGSPKRYRHVIPDSGLETAYSVISNLQLDRQISENLYVRLGAQRRESRNEFVVEPRTVDGQSVILLSNHGNSLYREYEITTRYSFADSQQVVFSYVRSSAVGNLNDFDTYYGNFPDPILRGDERAPLRFDTPHRFLTWADIKIPWDITVSPVADLHTGFPYSVFNEDFEFVGPRNRAGRFPRFFSLDLRVTKRVAVSFNDKQYGISIGVKIFNLTNHFNPRDVQNNLASDEFGGFYNSVGRTFRGKFEFDF